MYIVLDVSGDNLARFNVYRRGDVWTHAGNVGLSIEQQSILPPHLSHLTILLVCFLLLNGLGLLHVMHLIELLH